MPEDHLRWRLGIKVERSRAARSGKADYNLLCLPGDAQLIIPRENPRHLGSKSLKQCWISGGVTGVELETEIRGPGDTRAFADRPLRIGFDGNRGSRRHRWRRQPGIPQNPRTISKDFEGPRRLRARPQEP